MEDIEAMMVRSKIAEDMNERLKQLQDKKGGDPKNQLVEAMKRSIEVTKTPFKIESLEAFLQGMRFYASANKSQGTDFANNEIRTIIMMIDDMQKV